MARAERLWYGACCGMDAADVVITREELEEAWQVLSVAERIDGLLCLRKEDAQEFFKALNSVDQATLLLDMEPDRRAEWASLLDTESATDVATAAAEPDRDLLIAALQPSLQAQVEAQLEEVERVPSMRPSAVGAPVSDLISAHMQVYRTVGGSLQRCEDIEPGVWINLVNPGEREMVRLSERLEVELDLLKAALDEEERPRVAIDGAMLIIIDLPAMAKEGTLDVYTTIPLGIILTRDCIVTVCLRGDTLMEEFASGKVKGLQTQLRTRFMLQILYRSSTRYLQYLRSIDRTSQRIEHELHGSLKNKELIQLLKLQKSLVYFSTSLRSNEAVLEKLIRLEHLRSNEVDHELFEDVVIENKQAVEMANIYSNILSGTMDAFASVISNNLNIVMKVLTSVTIVMAIPTMVASFFGMNVPQPLGGPNAFSGIVALSLLLCALTVVLLWRKRLF